MGVLPDWLIYQSGLVEPAEPNVKLKGRISYGMGSYGYDARLDYVFKCPQPMTREMDPKSEAAEGLRFYTARVMPTCIPPAHFDIPPNSMVIGQTIEKFKIPRSCIGIVQGRSTYARCGLIVNCTPLEPEWEGTISLTLINPLSVPIHVYPGEGICQVLFIRTAAGDIAQSECIKTLAERVEMIHNDPRFQDDVPRLKASVVTEQLEYDRICCETSYADKGGKYNKQTEPTSAKVD